MGLPQISTGAVAPHLYRPSRNEITEPRRQSTTSLIPRGRALFWEGECQAQKIKIVEGVVRAVRLLENGNRQILAFYWPGDVVMPTQSSCQRITAEAVTNCRVQRTTASSICQQDEPCGAHQLLAETLSLVITMTQKNSLAELRNFFCAFGGTCLKTRTDRSRSRSCFHALILRIIWVRRSKLSAVLLRNSKCEI